MRRCLQQRDRDVAKDLTGRCLRRRDDQRQPRIAATSNFRNKRHLTEQHCTERLRRSCSAAFTEQSVPYAGRISSTHSATASAAQPIVVSTVRRRGGEPFRALPYRTLKAP